MHSYTIFIRMCLMIQVGFSTVSCKDSDRNSSGSQADHTMKELQSLPYVNWTPSGDCQSKAGVQVNIAGAHSGVHLYTSMTRNLALLVDMSGQLLHTWNFPATGDKRTFITRTHAELRSDGLYVQSVDTNSFLKLDWESNVLFDIKITAHHDFEFLPDGDIAILANENRLVQHGGRQLPILDDIVVIIDSQGKIKRKFSLFPQLSTFVSADAWSKLQQAVADGDTEPGQDKPHDLFHTNSIQWIRWPDRGGESAILLSIRNLSRIVILGGEPLQVIWSSAAGAVQEQHHATLLDDGSILVFDNGVQNRRSRVVKFDRQGQIEVVFETDKFYTERAGAVQQLGNGNYLITDSGQGRAFEIDKNKQIVWDYWNPVCVDGKREMLYRVERVDQADYLAARGQRDNHGRPGTDNSGSTDR